MYSAKPRSCRLYNVLEEPRKDNTTSSTQIAGEVLEMCLKLREAPGLVFAGARFVALQLEYLAEMPSLLVDH